MIIKEFFSKFKDNSRTNCTFLEFKEFSRTKVIFKDFSRSVGTLFQGTGACDLHSINIIQQPLYHQIALKEYNRITSEMNLQ